MLPAPVLGIGDVADAQHFFDFLPALLRNRDGAMLFVDGVIASKDRLFETLLDLLAFFQRGNYAIDLVIFVGRFFTLSGND